MSAMLGTRTTARSPSEHSSSTIRIDNPCLPGAARQNQLGSTNVLGQVRNVPAVLSPLPQQLRRRVLQALHALGNRPHLAWPSRGSTESPRDSSPARKAWGSSASASFQRTLHSCKVRAFPAVCWAVVTSHRSSNLFALPANFWIIVGRDAAVAEGLALNRNPPAIGLLGDQVDSIVVGFETEFRQPGIVAKRPAVRDLPIGKVRGALFHPTPQEGHRPAVLFSTEASKRSSFCRTSPSIISGQASQRSGSVGAYRPPSEVTKRVS